MKPSLAVLALTPAFVLAACLAPQRPSVPVTGTGAVTSSAPSVSSAASSRARTGSAALLTERMLSGGLLEIGPANAPHVLLAVVNYDSDYSRSFLSEQLPRLAEDFIVMGELRVRLLPLKINKYPRSDAAASALACAAQQGKGLAMSDHLLVAETVPLPAAAITGLKLDAAAYRTCIDSPAIRTMVEDQRLEAQRLDVRYAPVFFLDEERFEGLADYPDLRGRVRNAIEE